MSVDKLYESLGLEKLDEDKQTEIKTYITDLIDVKASELVTEKLAVEKEALVEKYEAKFETYKDELVERFSNFVDDILEKELVIPEHIKEYAKKGELYDPLVEQFKILIGIQEGVLDETIKETLQEAKSEIIKLKAKVNDLISEKTEVETDARTLATEIYIRKKCDGLTESKRQKVMDILEGITDVDQINRKFKIVLESEKHRLDEKLMYCPSCDTEVEVDDAEADEATCPECGEYLTDSKGKTDEQIKPEDKKQPIKESTSIMDYWKKVVETNIM